MCVGCLRLFSVTANRRDFNNARYNSGMCRTNLVCLLWYLWVFKLLVQVFFSRSE